MNRYSTIKDVARLAGTTAATVSYVLNAREGRYISKETRQKVEEAANELDYIKCNRASSLKGKNSKLIAILVPQFENQFFTRIIVSAQEVFVKHNYDMVICNTWDNPEQERDIIHRMLQQRVDGILLAPTSKGAENTETLRRLGIKMVAVDRPLEGTDNICSIATGNYESGYKGASFLFEKGHKEITFIGWKSQIADLDKRRLAVLESAKDKGIPLKNVLIKEGDFSQEEGYRLTAEVLDNNPGVTAFFYGFNVQALGGVKCLLDRGIKIPDEKSVLLIGNPEWAVSGGNNYSHISMSENDLGKGAAELLMNMLKNPENDFLINTTVSCTLVEGNSVRLINKEERFV